MIPPWSYSNLRNYEQCPKKYNHMYILKDLPKEPPTEALKYGNLVHSAMEHRINKGTPLPQELSHLEKFCSFGPYMVKAEVSVAIRANGQPCGFWDSDVWGRGKIDVEVTAGAGFSTAVLYDWKTGKRYEDPEELELQAALLKASKLHLEKITGHYVWLKDDKVGKPHDLSATDEKLMRVREKCDEISHQLSMGYMPPKQGPLCGWCPVKSCEFNPKRGQ